MIAPMPSNRLKRSPVTLYLRPAIVALATVACTLACGDSVSAPVRAPAVASIALAVATPIMVVGRSATVVATLRDSAGHKLSGINPTWSSTDQTIVAVSPAGQITASAPGHAVIDAAVGEHSASVAIDVAPASIPILDAPFFGSFALLNPMDHDVPLEFVDHNGIQIDWTGTAGRFLDGHSGFDWQLPMGTPVLAAAAGKVNFATTETPFSCPLLGGAVVAAQVVNIVHQAPTGELFATEYVHLSRIDVQKGDSVTAGEQVGLSGSTGCSTGPHLHFQVAREQFTRSGTRVGVTVDPFGWVGSQADPWLLDPRGAASSNLWIPGQSPIGQLFRTSILPPTHASSSLGTSQAQPSKPAATLAAPTRTIDIEHMQPSLDFDTASKNAASTRSSHGSTRVLRQPARAAGSPRRSP
jgi:murein DD-endopeptidase MepM/ murein hydrolase activator NlpD